ncbi:2,5-dichloro-2,5-cyclohexadiene-1,4-diol dehydrogenase [Sphingomonas sp. Root710]|uniref:SDR family NAD(P)-dependent oxidoreductase n=1 Tax=Sphingomonas sp. Root710 TaxID=1736594 RepID=UPI0006F492D9|nr:SDR family NAD(P)-dependent oxidoreductase [Sphingomonas sp. Root710]KRB86166.1 2,5-dichloro-2,5-cyclohexadiene-1,4-diol dehydrogenase [Sphingomonas sp. Root710]
MRLQGKLAIVTAAASGMGRAGVERFVREGARVAAIDFNGAALDALVAEIGADKVVPIVADLSTPEGARDSIDQAVAALGGADILWAHAGMPGPASVENLDMAAYDKAIALNITSATLGAGQVAQHMRRRGGGSIIFTASVSGLVGSMMSPIYSAAKWGVVGLTKSLALALAPDNIRVNVVCPGLADTPMKVGFTGRSGDPAEAAANEAKLMANVPMGRLVKAGEVADAALWLASDEASFVTGVALPVDGGFTAR